MDRQLLRFGIPSLDGLIRIPKKVGREGVPVGESTVSACISGPAGTGKSVLGLHLASRYVTDVAGNDHTRVIYASTDLSHPQAKKAWTDFALHSPNKRIIPFAPADLWKPTGGRRECQITLEEYGYNPAKLAKFVHEHRVTPKSREVGFINLQRSTAGDDWGFLNRLIASLPDPGSKPKHLVVVDAVEGLETLAGNVDSFGVLRARRSRVAQLVRTASRKCHVLFIVEDLRIVKREIAENPEEYVTDIVLRLSNLEVRQYRRRVVEILKVRFGSHVRGEHQILIRDGGGSSTGIQDNSDDPVVPHPDDAVRRQGYVHVVSSLHAVNRQVMKRPFTGRTRPPENWFAEFGIEHLDNMLAKPAQNEMHTSLSSNGLPCGMLTALIGEEGTQKSRLAEAFIARAFASWAEELKRMFSVPGSRKTAPDDWDTFIRQRARHPDCAGELWAKLRNTKCDVELWSERLKPSVGEYFRRYWSKGKAWVGDPDVTRYIRYRLVNPGRHGQAAIYLCTDHVDVEILAERCIDKLCSDFDIPADNSAAAKDVRSALGVLLRHYLICRRLEIHDLSSAVLSHVIQAAVTAAQRLLVPVIDIYDPRTLFQHSGGIRLAIDDLRVINHTYPDVKEDPLFLPHLRFSLGLEGITTLIVASEAGRPDAAMPTRSESELLRIADHRLHTWRIPFQGYSRVAIAAVPPIGMANPVYVRELRSHRERPNSLYVDPGLELWDGLLEGDLKRVGLEVRLTGITALARQYANQIDAFLGELFTPSAADGRIVPMAPPSYEGLRALCYLQTDIQLEQTLVFPVDEFWGRDRRTGLRDCRDYLEVIPSKDREGFADPHNMFTPRRMRHAHGGAKRTHFKWPGPWDSQTDRIPYIWDFGFLLCQELVWRESYRLSLPVLSRTVEALAKKRKIKIRTVDPSGNALKGLTVRQVAEVLRYAGQKISTGPLRLSREMEPNTLACFVDPLSKVDIPSTSWRVVLEACSVVAAHNRDVSQSRAMYAFDVDMLAPETFNCLVLEMWMSEILLHKRNDMTSAWLERQERRERVGERPLIGELVRRHSDELFGVLILLAEVFDQDQFAGSESGFEFAARESHPYAVATRHWYSTATHAVQRSHDTDRLISVRLPGRFSVRGDWFLATAEGSRSKRLADEVFDVLSSRRANYDRLQWGIGLPTRDILPNLDVGKEVNIRTALAVTKKSSRDPGLTYQGLQHLGARAVDKDVFGDAFHWLWRSQVAHYDRDRGLWLKWLWRAIDRFLELKRQQRSEWISGFLIYDHLWFPHALRGTDVKKLEVFSEFEKLKAVLIQLLPDEDIGRS